MTTLKQFNIVINENFLYVEGYKAQRIKRTFAYLIAKNNLICHEHYEILWEGIEFGINDSYYGWRISWGISKKSLETFVNEIVVETI